MKLEDLRDYEADLWVFDNDGTLYRDQTMKMAVENLMVKYIACHYGLDMESAREKRKQLLCQYNTRFTLIALKYEGFPEDDFIQKTYLSVDPTDFGIVRSQRTIDLLSSLEGKKIVLTNSPSEFADQILKSIGLRDIFSDIVGVRERDYIQKPEIEAFRIVFPWIEEHKVVVVVDDSDNNIAAARSIGCITVHAEGGLQ